MNPSDAKRTVHETFRYAGYDHEEDYFYSANRALIERTRKELDAKRLEREAESRSAMHWHKCPKCGGAMSELETFGVMGDVCKDCGGVFFDRAELAALTTTEKSNNVLAAIRKILKAAITPRQAQLYDIPI